MRRKRDTWAERVASFLRTADVSPSSTRTYREALKNFLSWLRDKQEVATADIKAYKDHLRLERSANTTATYLVALRRFFGHCVAHGHCDQNPVEHIKGMRRPRGHLRRDLSRDALRRLLEVIPRDNEMGKRDYAMVNLMVRNGCRVIEVQRANTNDLEVRQGRQILRIWGKGRDERDEFVVLTDPTIQALEDYLAVRCDKSGNSPLFVGVVGRGRGKRLTTRQISRQITGYLIKANVKTERISPHSLRHSFVTLAIESGASIIEAQIAARHRSIETTRVYFHERDRLDAPVEDRIKL